MQAAPPLAPSARARVLTSSSPLRRRRQGRFRELCSRAFIILRNHAHDLLNLVAQMVPARLPELSAMPDIEYMRHMFKLHLDDAQCAAWWTRTLDKYSSNTRNAMKAFDNQMHIIKHTGGKKAAAIERLIARLRSELQRRQEVIGEHIVLPYGLHVKRLVVEKCKVMSSAALPLWLAFEGVTPPAGVESTQSPDFFVRLAGRRAALRMFMKCARTPMAIMAGVRAPMRA